MVGYYDPWPDNLFEELNYHVPQKKPLDFNATLAYIIANTTPRNADIIFLRYRWLHTYEEIAVKYGITRQRVSQIIQKEIRRLKTPEVKQLLNSGLNEYHLQFISKETSGSIKSSVENDLYSMSIYNLHLSNRCYNALSKYGIKTVGDLISEGRYMLKKIPGIGKTCLNEIISQLSKLNLRLK